MDCTDAIQKVLKGEKPEKERRKRFVFHCSVLLLFVYYWGRPTPAAELSKAKSSDKSKHGSSKPTADKKPAASSTGSSSNLKEDGSQPGDQKVDTVRSRPKAADKDGRKDHKVCETCVYACACL